MKGVTTAEILSRVRRGYLERLELRMRKMRRYYAEKNWRALREECEHIHSTADRFGLHDLGHLAKTAEIEISDQNFPLQVTGSSVKAVENFLSAVDHILVTDQWERTS